MSNPVNIVTEVPKAPDEVTLDQALGLIPVLAGQSSEQSFKDRLRIHDPVVRVFSLNALCAPDMRFDYESLAMAMHVMRRSSFLRQVLVPKLLRQYRFDLADKVIEAERAAAGDAEQLHGRLMVAQRYNKFEEQAELHVKLYLQTGDAQHLQEASTVARERLPWRRAWKHALRMILVQTDKLERSLLAALQMFDRENARSEFLALGKLVCRLEGNKLARSYVIAQNHYWKKEYQKCIEFLHTSRALEVSEKETPLLPNLAARCYEALGNFKEAAVWYDKQNLANADEKYVPSKFLEELDTRASVRIKPMPKDPRSNYCIMTGFPRSGTTLLENALNAHPDIATCEETSSLVGSLGTAYTSPMDQDPKARNYSLRAFTHRQLYYQSLERWITKPDAKIVIDKTPIISANIKYMEKIFPEKRYIFSIRHPYDVVLSNWKQTYSQNPAMAAFNDIHDACVLYNHVMSDWFEVFPGETDRVYYVVYDELVTDFRRVVEGAIDFLGLEWTDEVLKFTEHSANRAVRTPSYANVRKGLTLGVQTSWRNFDFLFDRKCRELLDPWTRRFGYDAVAGLDADAGNFHQK
ncbi:MAG: sulfotransferase [Pseudohongiellaceae bacterium]